MALCARVKKSFTRLPDNASPELSKAFVFYEGVSYKVSVLDKRTILLEDYPQWVSRDLFFIYSDRDSEEVQKLSETNATEETQVTPETQEESNMTLPNYPANAPVMISRDALHKLARQLGPDTDLDIKNLIKTYVPDAKFNKTARELPIGAQFTTEECRGIFIKYSDNTAIRLTSGSRDNESDMLINIITDQFLDYEVDQLFLSYDDDEHCEPLVTIFADCFNDTNLEEGEYPPLNPCFIPA